MHSLSTPDKLHVAHGEKKKKHVPDRVVLDVFVGPLLRFPFEPTVVSANPAVIADVVLWLANYGLLSSAVR